MPDDARSPEPAPGRGNPTTPGQAGAQDPAHDLPAGSALAYWIAASGFSQRGLAAAIIEHARKSGHAQVRPDGSRVRRWIGGQRPRPPVPEILAAVLSDACGRQLTPADLGLADADPSDLTRYRGPETVLADLGELTLTSPGSQPASSIDTTTPPAPDRMVPALETWAYAHPHKLPGVAGNAASPDPGHVRLGMTDAQRIAEYTATFRRLDNAHGGGSTLDSAAGQLAWANRMISRGTYTEPTGRALFRELADLAGVVGWACHDTARWPAAIRFLTLAVHAARESGDQNLTAHLLQCLARVWGYLGKPAIAADCIALAIYGARNSAHPVLRAGLHSLAARFAAMQGDAPEALRNVRLADELFTDDPRERTPAYIEYLDYPELASTCGEVMLFLARTTCDPHHAETAVQLLTAAARDRDANRTRSRAFDAIAAARSHLVVGNLDAAHDATLTAIDVGTTVISARVQRRFADLAREMHDERPESRTLRDQLLDLAHR